jgi:hypothetical protein
VTNVAPKTVLYRVACLLAVMASGSLGCARSDARSVPLSDSGTAGSGGLSDGSGTGGSSDATADTPTDGAQTDLTVEPREADDASVDRGDAAAGLDATLDYPVDSQGPDGGSVLCKTQGTELCEGFESGAIDPKIWGQHASTGAALTVDKLHAHGGNYALHVKLVPGQSNTAQLTDAVTFPAKNNTFYTRAYLYFSPDLPADNAGGFHMAYLLATGNNDLGFVEAGLGSAGDRQYLGYSEYYGAGPGVHAHGPTFTEFGPDSPTRVVPGRWICLELLQGGDATATVRQVWVDGQELPEQKNSFSDRKPPQFDLMSIGVLQYHPTPILSDVWIDDIRVSSDRIGCAPASP